MPLRDLALTAFVFGSLPFCFLSPYVGVLMFSWLGFMNPHVHTWSFAYELQLSHVVAIATLLGLLFTKDRRPIPREREVALLVALWGLFVLTTVFALYPEVAWPNLKEVSKILLMVFVVIMVCQERSKLRNLLLVTALSIGFYGLKGGIWGLTTGGTHRVLGPAPSIIADNNALAMGLDMTLPLLFFLAREEKRRWLRLLLRVTFIFSIVAVPLTYARGGFLGLVAVLLLLLVRTRLKVLVVPIALLGVVSLAWFLPPGWYTRIGTIAEYEADSSANARFISWSVGWQLALDSPLLGGGFQAFTTPETYARYAPGYPYVHNAHSIYFHVLGEHGFTGFILFIGLILSVLLSLRQIRHRAKAIPGANWLVDYSHMVQASVWGFLVCGVFYNLTYFDFFYLLIGVTVILKRLLSDVAVAAAGQPRVEAVAARGRTPFPVRRLSPGGVS